MTMCPLSRSSFRATLLALSLASGVAAMAQQPGPPSPQPPPAGLVGPDIAPTLALIAPEPSTHMAFTFDRSMLSMADQFFHDNGGTLSHEAIAGIDSITVETWRFQNDAHYDPQTLDTVVESYHVAGWKHLVETRPQAKGYADPMPVNTDLWLHFDGPNIHGVSILTRGARTMSLIHVNGVFRPLDLVHLGGHFGIPKVDPNAVMVPAPR